MPDDVGALLCLEVYCMSADNSDLHGNQFCCTSCKGFKADYCRAAGAAAGICGAAPVRNPGLAGRARQAAALDPADLHFWCVSSCFLGEVSSVSSLRCKVCRATEPLLTCSPADCKHLLSQAIRCTPCSCCSGASAWPDTCGVLRSQQSTSWVRILQFSRQMQRMADPTTTAHWCML